MLAEKLISCTLLSGYNIQKDIENAKFHSAFFTYEESMINDGRFTFLPAVIILLPIHAVTPSLSSRVTISSIYMKEASQYHRVITNYHIQRIQLHFSRQGQK